MNESLIIWGAVAALAAIIFFPYFLKFRQAQREHLQRREEAESLGILQPQSQYPQINQSLCIGCGACVRACPEGDVLGVVYGKAMIVNGQRCVGHGHCEQACPVSAIKVGLGDITARDDIPILDEQYQSNIPGLYVVGELGGLSLIRNAINQGRQAVAAIAARPERSSDGGIVDVLIAGAGPSGLSAALAAIDKNLSYLVLDRQSPGGTILQYPRRKLVMTQPAEIPLYGTLEKSSYEKEALLEIWEGLIDKFQVQIDTGRKVDGLEKNEGVFTVSCGAQKYKARNVILALGRRGTPRKLGVPGEDLKKVAYQLIDAQSYQNNHVMVVGGGDSAVEAAVGLARQKGNTVTISYRKLQFFRIKKKNQEAVEKYISRGQIIPEWNSQVTSIDENTVTLSTPDGEKILKNEYLFIFAGGLPPFKMLKEMGIRFGGDAVPYEI